MITKFHNVTVVVPDLTPLCDVLQLANAVCKYDTGHQYEVIACHRTFSMSCKGRGKVGAISKDVLLACIDKYFATIDERMHDIHVKKIKATMTKTVRVLANGNIELTYQGPTAPYGEYNECWLGYFQEAVLGWVGDWMFEGCDMRHTSSNTVNIDNCSVPVEVYTFMLADPYQSKIYANQFKSRGYELIE